MRQMGFETFLPDALQAPIIVTFLMPADPNFDFGVFYDGLKARGFVIYPGKLTVANFGPGAVWHLAAIAVEKAAGIELTHLPFDGAVPAVVQLLGNHVDAVMVSPAEVLQHAQVRSEEHTSELQSP